MPVDPRNRDEVIETATLIATRGGTPERLERLAELVGADRDRDEVGRAVAAFGTGEGQLDTCVVVLMLPEAEVKRLLPLGLELAPNPLSPVGKHPVFVQLSHNRFSEFGGMDYDEMMLGVPYVQLSTWRAPRRGPFIYMPRLYLDADLPRWLGNYLYGYEKLPAIIDRDFPEVGGTETNRPETSRPETSGPEAGRRGHYRVLTTGSGVPLVQATLHNDGPRGAPSSFDAFTHLRQLFEMPTISQAARIWDADAFESDELSPFLASNLVYGFDHPDAWIEPMRVELSISAALTPAGIAGTYAAPSLLHAPLGAFRMFVKLGVALPSAPATLRYPVPPPARRQRVLVLGGGPAACAAAYWLGRQRDRYDVKMYTQGFRLGGKCSAGRNAEADMRIEEHGLHAFLGFYENAFRTVRNVYETVGIPIEGDSQPLGGAFLGSTENGLMIDRNGRWKYFATPLATNDRVPGHVPEETQDDDGDLPPVTTAAVGGLGEMMVEAFRHAARQTAGLQHDVDLGIRLRRAAAADDDGEPDGMLAGLLGRLRELGQDLVEDVLRGPMELVGMIVRYLEDRAATEVEGWLAEGCDGPLKWVHGTVRLLVRLLDEIEERRSDDDEIWYQWMSLSTLFTAIAGIIEDRVTHLDQLDGEDMWAWFRRHGLDPRLLPAGLGGTPGGQPQGSPAIAGVYETLFAHGFDTTDPRELAAGVGLRWFFLSGFGYAGYPAYEFKYSCPQTLLTPYYRALTGPLEAEVHFFHRVTELKVEGQGDARRLVGVKLQRQATVRDGSAAYRPFVRNPPPSNPAAQPPWPNEPDYDQLVEGERLRTQKVDLESLWSPWPGVDEVELLQGRDFDLCILGISLAALPPLCGALCSSASPSHDPRWATMMERIAVTETVSMQLWLTKPEAELYEGQRGLLTAYVEPEPSVGMLSHLIQWEGWSGDDVPKSLAYHTGSLTAQSVLEHPPFTDHEYPARRDAWWRRHARQWLQSNYAGFYDKAPREWEAFLGWLALPGGAAPNADRLDAQYFNSGCELSDLYVLSQPRGMPARMGQMESGVTGLYLCGDWTRTDMNCGCVEAATQSGMLCARGISQHPVYVWRPGL